MKNRKIMIIVTLVCALVMAAAGIAVVSVQGGGKPEEKSAQYYVGRGDTCYGEGDYTMALACYTKALTMEENNIAALHGAGKTNGALGYVEEAVQCYETLAALEPENAGYQLERVNAMIAAGRLDQAKETLEGLLSVFSDERMEQLYRQMTLKSPQADLEAGTYDSYQLLNLFSDNENTAIYYTLDGSEPHTGSLTYTDHIVISAPETKLRAKCINYLGYESDVLELDYIVTVPVEKIMSRNYSSVTNAVRTALNKGYDDVIYNYEAARITSLYVIGDGYYENPESTDFYKDYFHPINYSNGMNYRGDGNMSYLKYTPFLETLAVCWQNRVNVPDLLQLKHLKNLSLLNNQIKDISALSKFTGLEKLALGWNKIEDISALQGLENLTSLGLWNNNIKNIDALAGLQNLQYLDISNNQITSLEPLARLAGLQEFWGNGNQITSISPLDPRGTLQILMMAGNPLEDYSGWKASHPNLTHTDIAG